MAVLGVLLGAQHRNPLRVDSPAQSFESPSECCGTRHRVVAHAAVVVVEVLVVRSATELAPEEHVPHTDSPQRIDEPLAVEP